MQEFLSTARAVALRVASNLVDVHQLSMYHRRWSFTQGAEQKVRRRLLQEKTDGNLTEDEERLLRTVLYDLRVAYVDAKKAR